MPAFTSDMLTSLIPETGLLVLATLLLVLVLVKNEKFYIHLDWITAAGFTLIAVLAFIFGRPAEEPRLLWGEMIRVDRAGYLLSLMVLVGGALTAVFAGTDGNGWTRNPNFTFCSHSRPLGLC